MMLQTHSDYRNINPNVTMFGFRIRTIRYILYIHLGLQHMAVNNLD